MKFLEDIAALKEAAVRLEQAKADLQATLDAARPRAWKISIEGQVIHVSERDMPLLFAALIRAIDGETVSLPLGGQTVKLRIGDLESIAAAILETPNGH